MSGAGNMGNSENTSDTTGIRPIHGKGDGTHFGNEELLAYLHKDVQGSTLWNIQHQHISNCSACRTQLAELEQSEQLLKRAVHSSYYDFYPSITNAVMERISESNGLKQTPYRSGASGSRSLKGVSVALVAAALCIIIFGRLLLMKLPTSSGHGPVVVSPVAKLTVLTVPSHSNVTPTMVPTALPVKVKTVVKPVIAIWNCTTGTDQQRQHLRICGSGFIAGDNVAFTVVNSNGKSFKQIGSLQVLMDGTFEEIIPIHSCRDVPAAINALDTSMKPTEKLAAVSIRYGKC